MKHLRYFGIAVCVLVAVVAVIPDPGWREALVAAVALIVGWSLWRKRAPWDWP